MRERKMEEKKEGKPASQEPGRECGGEDGWHYKSLSNACSQLRVLASLFHNC